MALSHRLFVLTAAVAPAVLATSPASAQYFERNHNESVRERPQPEYDPIGVPVGAFRGYATMPVGVTFNDNIFALDTNEADDVVIAANPSVELRSQWSRHSLNFAANLLHESYDEFSSEDRDDFTVSSRGRLDVQRSFFVDGDISERWGVEPRTNASTPINTLKPIEFTALNAGVGVTREVNRLRLSGRVAHQDYDFDNGVLNDGSNTVVLQDDRDHEYLAYSGRVDYAVTGATAIFGAISTSRRDYDIQPADDPNVFFSRDSHGYTYSVGADFDVTRLVRGQVSVGYLSEEFIDSSFSDIDGLAASATVEWFASPVATVELTAERSVTDTGIVGAAAALSTVVGARLDYELRRNIVVTGQMSVRDDDYEGISRDDDGLAAGLDVTYLFNRNVGASVGVAHTERDSSGAQPGVGFEQQTLGVNLVLRR